MISVEEFDEMATEWAEAQRHYEDCQAAKEDAVQDLIEANAARGRAEARLNAARVLRASR